MNLCVAVWLLSIGTTLAQPRVHIPIISGGKPAQPNQYPWMMSLINRKYGRHDCGAFLISVKEGANQSDMAITAAHCVVNSSLVKNIHQCIQARGKEHIPLPDPLYLDKDKFSVIAGNHAISSSVEMQKEHGVEWRSISRMEMHPKFGAECIDYRHDIAVLKLDRPINFTDKIQPIRLPQRGYTLNNGQVCTTAGWGSIGTSEGNRNLNCYLTHVLPLDSSGKNPDVLHHINVSIVPSDRCSELIAKAEKILGRKMQHVLSQFLYCANPGRAMASTCGGDSGGPFFCKERNEWIAHGVVSTGYPACNGHGKEHWASPEMFTKIEPHLDWIEEKIRDWSEIVV